jgi:predicted HTH domain antitoxin
MTLELPDTPATRDLTPDELRLELACALYARGRIGKAGGAELAGVDFFTFQQALGDRAIESYTPAMLDEDVATLRRLFAT